LTESGDLSVYPNPTADKVFINIGNRVILERDVTISDISGRKVHADINKITGPVLELDMSGLDSGVYIIRLTLGNEQKNFRIIRR
jgi:hypothetical protein